MGGHSKHNLPVIPDRRSREITINETFYLKKCGGGGLSNGGVSKHLTSFFWYASGMVWYALGMKWQLESSFWYAPDMIW